MEALKRGTGLTPEQVYAGLKGASEGEKLRKAVGIYSDDPEADVPPQRRHEPATGFNRLETKHHRRHAQEMGFKSMQEYEKAAVAFFNSDKGKLYYTKQEINFIAMKRRRTLWLFQVMA